MNRKINPKPLTQLCPLILLAALSGTVSQLSLASDATWQPVSSEKLMRLPTNYIDRAVESNFRDSPLAAELMTVEQSVRTSGASMSELRDLIALADGGEKITLRHQFLNEKSAYLDSMEVQHELRKKALNKKVAVFESVLGKLRKERHLADDPVAADVMEKQREARARMERSVALVDATLFDVMPGEQSRYDKEYNVNLAKIEELKQAIVAHAANSEAQINGTPATREEYVRHLLVEAQTGLALLDQEEEMLGYMARLVALDAEELQHEIEVAMLEEESSSASNPTRLVDSVGLFTN